MAEEISGEERFFNLRKDPLQIPGPIDHREASHWVEYDHENHTVETWCSFGPERQFSLKQRVRPMITSEVIMSKLRDYRWQDVLLAFGVDETRMAKADPSTGPNTHEIIKTVEGYSKEEVLKAYEITGEIPDAVIAQESNKKTGFLHNIRTWLGCGY
jgi:hypothetical protein